MNSIKQNIVNNVGMQGYYMIEATAFIIVIIVFVVVAIWLRMMWQI